MRLTIHTDYALRTLIFLGVAQDRLVRVGDIATAYGISRNHLMKVANHLAAGGYLEAVRGRGGGIRLARAPAEINIGAVTRYTEGDFALVECFRPDGACRIATGCLLRSALRDALGAFFAVLDGYSLQDLLGSRPLLLELFGMVDGPRQTKRRRPGAAPSGA